MDARVLARIWFILPPFLNIVESTSSVSLKQDYEYEKNNPTENFKPAIPTERLEFLASTNAIESIYIYEPATVTGKIRSYRQADLEAITSIEPIVVTESGSPYEQNDLTDKYNTATTKGIKSNKSVIPLTSTETYDLSNKTESIIPVTATEKYDYRQISELTKINTDVESTSNFNRALETITPSIQWLSSSEENTIIEPSEELPVVGISKTKPLDINDVSKEAKHIEIMMILQQSKEEKYVWLKETVHNMLEDTMLKRETENYVIQLNRRYDDLPVIESDNSVWRKYSRAVSESFVLDFCRNYPHYTVSQQSFAQWYNAEEYNRIYNTTLLHLQQKKEQTAVQFAAPVRRAVDIYKAILDTPIGIVQSKCTADMPRWLCFAEYVVRLADVSETCEHVWYHAQVHLTVLQSIRLAKGATDPADKIIAELDSRISAVEPNNNVNYLFDFIIKTLGDLSKTLKEPLLSQVSLHSLIRELQSEDNLNCLSIDEQGL